MVDRKGKEKRKEEERASAQKRKKYNLFTMATSASSGWKVVGLCLLVGFVSLERQEELVSEAVKVLSSAAAKGHFSPPFYFALEAILS